MAATGRALADDAVAADVDVAVLEDVWGAPFADLSRRYRVRRISTADATPEVEAEAIRRATCLVVRNRTIVDRRLLLTAPALRVIARAGAGLDNIDIAAADDLGVVVIAAKRVNATSVAEMAIGLALGLARRISSLDREVRLGSWDRRPGVELAGRTWGVLGLGSTGIATAQLAAALGMVVVGHDPYVGRDDMARETAVRFEALEVVQSEADVLSIHVPLTTTTRGLIDERFLARMRRGAFLVNVARGEIVDEGALFRALTTGVIAGAALDVRAIEPAIPGPLDALDNVILTPHVAGLTEAASARVAETLAADLERLLGGGEAQNAVGAVMRMRP